MFTYPNLLRRGGRILGAGVLVAALLGVIAPASGATPVRSIAGNISPTQLVYDYISPDVGEWMVPDGVYSQGRVVEHDDLTPRTLHIAPAEPYATFNWWGNMLDEDTSDPFTGGAHATFFGGGSMTLEGQLWDLGEDGLIGGTGPDADALLFDGLLMEGTVSAFTVDEPFDFTDLLEIVDPVGVATVHPTGGYLVDPLSGSPMRMMGDYDLSVIASGAKQNGGPLEDFQQDIVTVNSMQVVLAYLPEPTTALFAGLGFALFGARRRGRRAV